MRILNDRDQEFRSLVSVRRDLVAIIAANAAGVVCVALGVIPVVYTVIVFNIMLWLTVLTGVNRDITSHRRLSIGYRRRRGS